MAIVQMKCPNCGGNLLYRNNQFQCPYCHMILLNIADAKIDGDVTVMGADEFSRKLEESKRQFVININDKLEIGDIDTMVANKMLKDATLMLELGKYKDVEPLLSGVPSCFAKYRLLFLASYQVHSEAELMFYDGLLEKGYYSQALKYADEPTKRTYIKMAELCRIRCNIHSEIDEVERLWDVNLKQEALAYAKSMCQRYPQSAASWSKLFDIKSRLDEAYIGDLEYGRMIACPDYKGELPGCMKDRFDRCSPNFDIKLSRGLRWLIYGTLCGLVLCISLTLSFGFFTGLWLYDSPILVSLFFGFGFPLLALAGFIAMIVFLRRAKVELMSVYSWRYFYSTLKYIPKTAQQGLIQRYRSVRHNERPVRIGNIITSLILIGSLVGTGIFIPFLLHPTIDGLTYRPTTQSSLIGKDNGYELTEIHTDSNTFILPEKALFNAVIDISFDVVIDSNVPIKEIVIHYRAGKWIASLSAFTALERIFLDAPYPTEGCEDEFLWDLRLESNYYSDATIYWRGEWKMENGKPVVLKGY